MTDSMQSSQRSRDIALYASPEARLRRIVELEADNERLRQALLLIQHATAPGPDDGYHEAAHDLASTALEVQ